MGVSMRSVKNHLSLIVALVSILFSIQIFVVVERSIDAYKQNLAKNYSVVVVAQKPISDEEFFRISRLISDVDTLMPDNVIKRLNKDIGKTNMEFLKLTLPKFYKLHLKKYPSPDQIKRLRENLLANRFVTKVEDFSSSHDTIYKLLVLFKNVVLVFAAVVSVVTMLLILKELRIWQFKHNERMSIMGLFGAPTWLRSAVLFRLSIVDAIISSGIIFFIFTFLSSSQWVRKQFENIGISVVVFDATGDFLTLFGISVCLSIILASMIVLGHIEEV